MLQPIAAVKVDVMSTVQRQEILKVEFNCSANKFVRGDKTCQVVQRLTTAGCVFFLNDAKQDLKQQLTVTLS
jgi:hypothetical protein